MPKQNAREFLTKSGKVFMEVSQDDLEALRGHEIKRDPDADTRLHRAIYSRLRDDRDSPNRLELAALAGKRARYDEEPEAEYVPDYSEAIDEHLLRAANNGDTASQELVHEQIRNATLMQSLRANRGHRDRVQLARTEAQAFDADWARDVALDADGADDLDDDPDHAA